LSSPTQANYADEALPAVPAPGGSPVAEELPGGNVVWNLFRRLAGHPVATNALALYGIQFAGYVIPLLTLPYLARVLRAQEFGLLLFSQSFALWASITLEYGFNLCATREVAQNRGNRAALAATAAGVLGAKLILLFGFTVIASLAAFTVGNFRQHPNYFLWAIPQALAFGFSPFWYFQGTERMVGAVVVEFFARIAAAASIFLIVRTPEDGWKALAALAAAGCAVLLIQMVWMYGEIGFRRPRWEESIRALKLGWDMFLFRGAYNVYSAANAFILGLFVPAVQVGYYGGAERIARAMQGLTLPFTQALYPHMSRLASGGTPKATRLARFTLPLAGGGGLLLAVGLALLASRLVHLILGREYESSIRVLYIFALIIPLNAMNNALIMQWMLPHGMERMVRAAVAGAILINVISASVLAPLYAHLGMAWAILIAEAFQSVALVAMLLRGDLALREIFREARSYD
jgi:polysaccharide transporter, PST family